MKVIHIVWSLKYGGVETMLTNIVKAQAEAGADVCVMIINDNWDDELICAFDDRVTLLYVHKKLGAGTPWFLFRLNRMLKAEKPDVIHLHGAEIWSLIFPGRLSRRTCVTIHDIPHGEMHRSGVLYRVFPKLDLMKRNSNVRNADRIGRVFAISTEVHDQLIENYGVESVTVTNGISVMSFRCRGQCIPGSPFRIVQVGRLEHVKKGQDLLILAVAIMQGRVSVDFIGEGSSYDELRKLAADLHVEESVFFRGSKSQQWIKEHLSDYNLLVQPSRFEGFGLTVAEAMAAKVPVLVSAGERTADITCGERYGWTFESGNAKDLAEKIGWIMEHYEEALNKVSAAREYTIAKYDVGVTARRYLAEYESFLEESGKT